MVLKHGQSMTRILLTSNDYAEGPRQVKCLTPSLKIKTHSKQRKTAFSQVKNCYFDIIKLTEILFA